MSSKVVFHKLLFHTQLKGNSLSLVFLIPRILFTGGVFLISCSCYGNTFIQMCQNPTASQAVTLLAIAKSKSTNEKEVVVDCQQLEKHYVKRNYGHSLRLRNSNISDLTPLSFFTKSEELSLSGNNISDISPLSKLHNLTHLDIGSNPINDITPISDLTKLKNLWIDNTSPTPYNAKILKKLTNLTSLTLTGKFENMEIISLFKKLRSLSLMHTPMKNICMLEDLTNLEQLALIDNNISDIKCLHKLSKIYGFTLSNNPLKDLSVISNYKNLRKLNIRNTLVKDSTEIIKVKNIKWLVIDNTKINDMSGLYSPKMHIFSHRGTSLRWCSPKNTSDIVKEISCYDKNGNLKGWWKRLFRM